MQLAAGRAAISVSLLLPDLLYVFNFSDCISVRRPEKSPVLTGKAVAKVLFKEKVAVGGPTTSGEQLRASKEVLLSAATFDSSKILLLSGVGPTDELANLSIPLTHSLPGMGKGLTDQYGRPISFIILPILDLSTAIQPSCDFGIDSPII